MQVSFLLCVALSRELRTELNCLLVLKIPAMEFTYPGPDLPLSKLTTTLIINILCVPAAPLRYFDYEPVSRTTDILNDLVIY